MGLGGLECLMGYGLRQIRPWVRGPMMLLSALGIIGNIVTMSPAVIVSIYCFWLVAGKSGSLLFSPEYQEAMRFTPDMKYRPKSSWIVNGFLLLILGAICIALYSMLTS